jgi:hypothetical protein
MSDSEPTSQVKNRCASEQLGWRMSNIEASARSIVSHFGVLGIEGKDAKRLCGYLDEVVRVARERFMEATGGK